jgi:septal ring factor EnvC (AmiA/AmiB activator)
MKVGSRSDEETSRVPQYNFDRLEQSVEFLIKEHERLSSEREALVAELVDREHRIAVLESNLEKERGKRATAVEGVDKILARLEQLRTSVTSNVEASHE